MNALVVTGFVLGLTSSLHCIGMCGPIAMAIPINSKNNWLILLGILHYNFGRIFTYSLLGAFIGIIGLTVRSFGILQWLSIVSGLLLIAYAWRKKIGQSIRFRIPTNSINNLLSKGIGSVLKSKFRYKLPLLGMLNGLLPCGMVYLALMNALLTGSQSSGIFAMAAFGIGTLPSMIAVGFAAGKVSTALRTKLNATVPYILTLIGLLVVFRGMNLGIPYISPKAEMAMKTKTESLQTKPEMKMECCHSSKNKD